MKAAQGEIRETNIYENGELKKDNPSLSPLCNEPHPPDKMGKKHVLQQLKTNNNRK